MTDARPDGRADRTHLDIEAAELDFDAERMLDDAAAEPVDRLDAPMEIPGPDMIDQRRSVQMDDERDR